MFEKWKKAKADPSVLEALEIGRMKKSCIWNCLPDKRDGGTPISAPIDTPITVMEAIRVSFASGIREVKIPPITAKKRSGTR